LKFPSIRIEGSIFSSDILEKIEQGDSSLLFADIWGGQGKGRVGLFQEAKKLFDNKSKLKYKNQNENVLDGISHYAGSHFLIIDF